MHATSHQKSSTNNPRVLYCVAGSKILAKTATAGKRPSILPFHNGHQTQFFGAASKMATMKEQGEEVVFSSSNGTDTENENDSSMKIENGSSSRGSWWSSISRRHKMFLLAAGVVTIAFVSSLSTGLVLKLQDDDVCVEGEVQDLQGATLELTLGGLSEPLSEEKQHILEDAVLQAFNEVAQGCEDHLDRWMVTTTFEHQEVIITGDEYENMTSIVASIDMSISCDDCQEHEAFADEYPAFFGELERRLAASNPKDLLLNLASNSLTPTTTREAAVEPAVRGLRSLVDQMNFLNAADIIVAIEQTAADLGFIDQEDFQGLLEVAIQTRAQKLVLISNKKTNKKMGNAKKNGGRGNGGGGDKKDNAATLDDFTDILGRIADLLLEPEEPKDSKVCEEFAPNYNLYYGSCDGVNDVLGEVANYIEFSNCAANPPLNPEVIYQLFTMCSSIYDVIPEIQASGPSFFNPIQFNDGEYDQDALSSELAVDFPLLENKYAWAGDYNSNCAMGMMIHSAGTGSLLENDYRSAPTITFRDANGNEVYHDYVYEKPTSAEAKPDVGVGVRSGLIVDCAGPVMTIVIATFGLPGKLKRMKIDTGSQGPASLVDWVATDIFSPSVRTMIQNARGVAGCFLTFAPLNDIQDLEELTVDSDEFPLLMTYDWCNAKMVTQVASTSQAGSGDGAVKPLNADGEEIKTSELTGYFIWDLACMDGEMCWVNLVNGRKDKDLATGINLQPNLYFFPQSSLATDAATMGNDILLTAVTLGLNVDSSALALEVVDEQTVVACSLSGWVYQAVGDGRFVDTADVRRAIRRKLQGPLDEAFDVNLAGLELGQAQECNRCSSLTKSCSPIVLPDLASTSAYMWQVEKCGDYVFVGTLDANTIIEPLIQEEIAEQLANTEQGDLSSILDFSDRPAFREWFSSILSSLLFGAILSPYDKGFDLWYISMDELQNFGSPSFKPVTINGFKQEESEEDFGPLWPAAYRFTPNTLTEEGVRQLICHDNRYLMVGTAVYSDAASSSTWKLDLQDNPPGAVPVEPINFNPFVLPDTGLGSILSDPQATVDGADPATVERLIGIVTGILQLFNAQLNSV